MNKINKEIKILSQDIQLDNLNKYLAAGNGCGRLNSAAAVYNGQVGYFFVSSRDVGGVKQESIFFSCTGDDVSGSNSLIVITEFPAHPKYFEKKI